MGAERLGISPIISTVIIIAIVIATAAIISPWAFDLVTSTTNQTSSYQTQQMLCQNTAYTFDTRYGTNGITWNLTGTTNELDARVINTGSINLKDFRFEVTLNTTSGYAIYYVNINTTYQKTSANPLRPGESAILKANFTQDLDGTLKYVKVMNGVCPSVFIEQEV